VRSVAAASATLEDVPQQTIFETLYVQGRGELRRELARCLKSGRAAHNRQGQVEPKGQIQDITMISERPTEPSDRAVPGHSPPTSVALLPQWQAA
jgi:transposase, IS30 family